MSPVIRKPVPKTLLVGPSFSGGGAEMQFALLARHLFGGQADAVVLRGLGCTEEKLSGMIRKSLGWTSERSYPGIISCVRRLVRDRGYDAVLGYGIFPNLVAWLATSGMARRPALVLCEITRPRMAARMGKTRAVVRAMARRAYRSADLVAPNSQDGIYECADFYGVDRGRLVRVPNLLDIASIRDRASEEYTGTGRPQAGMLLVSSCRLERLKHIETLLSALAELPESEGWKAAIIGEGPDRCRLEALRRGLGLEDRAQFLGWQANPWRVVRDAFAFVHTSSCEGFSNSVLEAMALDVPVITSFWGRDAKEMAVRGAVLGFRPGDGTALIDHLRSLSDGRVDRTRLAAHGREFILRFEAERATREYEHLIYRIVAENTSPRPNTPVQSRSESGNGWWENTV